MALDKEAFRKILEQRLAENRAAFEGQYADELKGLLGLSQQEIAAITPATADQKVYADLITVVQQASATNLAQADLKARIQKLGETAVAIAKRVPKLAALFV